MTAKWGICVLLVALLALSSGCRTRQPNLKPETTAEQLIEPPAGQYATASMPKQAFTPMADPGKYALDAKSPGVLPTRGSMVPGAGAGPGMNSMR